MTVTQISALLNTHVHVHPLLNRTKVDINIRLIREWRKQQRRDRMRSSSVLAKQQEALQVLIDAADSLKLDEAKLVINDYYNPIFIQTDLNSNHILLLFPSRHLRYVGINRSRSSCLTFIDDISKEVISFPPDPGYEPDVGETEYRFVLRSNDDVESVRMILNLKYRNYDWQVTELELKF